MVVTTAASEREAELRRVGLEDHARVVAEIADDAEVKAHVLLDAVRLQQAVDLREVVECAAALLVECQRVALLEHVLAAVQQRQIAERLLGLLRKSERLDRAVEGDEVVLLERRLELLLRLVGELVLVHDARDELDLAEADREVREAGAQQALDGERDDLGISKGRRATHELDAGLMELTLAASLRLLIAEGTADIRELQRLRIVAQAAGCEARNRRRHLVAQRERAVVLVEELEEMRL